MSITLKLGIVAIPVDSNGKIEVEHQPMDLETTALAGFASGKQATVPPDKSERGGDKSKDSSNTLRATVAGRALSNVALELFGKGEISFPKLMKMFGTANRGDLDPQAIARPTQNVLAVSTWHISASAEEGSLRAFGTRASAVANINVSLVAEAELAAPDICRGASPELSPEFSNTFINTSSSVFSATLRSLSPIRSSIPPISGATTLVFSPLAANDTFTKITTGAPSATKPGNSAVRDEHDLDFALPDLNVVVPVQTQVDEPALPHKSITFSDFELIKNIGTGAFGAVYLGRHRSSNRAVAIKVVGKRPARQDDGRSVHEAMLEKDSTSLIVEEYLALRRVQGVPGMVELLGSCHDSDNFYFFMPCYAGGSLADEIHRRGHITIARAQIYAAELVLGVESLHKLGVIHRDLKPANVLIGNDGHLVIADFGLARAFSTHRCDAERLVYSGHLPDPHGQDVEHVTASCCGTPDFMAPELYEGMLYSYPVDIWGIGLIVYSMLFGKLPWKYEKYNNVVRNIIFDDITFDGDKCQEYSISLDARDFIEQTLRKKPDDRPTATRLRSNDFFAGIDLTALSKGEIPSLWVPGPVNLRPSQTIPTVAQGIPFSPEEDPLPFFNYTSPRLTSSTSFFPSSSDVVASDSNSVMKFDGFDVAHHPTFQTHAIVPQESFTSAVLSPTRYNPSPSFRLLAPPSIEMSLPWAPIPVYCPPQHANPIVTVSALYDMSLPSIPSHWLSHFDHISHSEDGATNNRIQADHVPDEVSANSDAPPLGTPEIRDPLLFLSAFRPFSRASRGDPSEDVCSPSPPLSPLLSCGSSDELVFSSESLSPEVPFPTAAHEGTPLPRSLTTPTLPDLFPSCPCPARTHHDELGSMFQLVQPAPITSDDAMPLVSGVHRLLHGHLPANLSPSPTSYEVESPSLCAHTSHGLGFIQRPVSAPAVIPGPSRVPPPDLASQPTQWSSTRADASAPHNADTGHLLESLSCPAMPNCSSLESVTRSKNESLGFDVLTSPRTSRINTTSISMPSKMSLSGPIFTCTYGCEPGSAPQLAQRPFTQVNEVLHCSNTSHLLASPPPPIASRHSCPGSLVRPGMEPLGLDIEPFSSSPELSLPQGSVPACVPSSPSGTLALQGRCLLGDPPPTTHEQQDPSSTLPASGDTFAATRLPDSPPAPSQTGTLWCIDSGMTLFSLSGLPTLSSLDSISSMSPTSSALSVLIDVPLAPPSISVSVPDRSPLSPATVSTPATSIFNRVLSQFKSWGAGLWKRIRQVTLPTFV